MKQNQHTDILYAIILLDFFLQFFHNIGSYNKAEELELKVFYKNQILFALF